jgi:hypothetical protein
MNDTQTAEDRAIEANARAALKKALARARVDLLAAFGGDEEQTDAVMEDVISGVWN